MTDIEFEDENEPLPVMSKDVVKLDFVPDLFPHQKDGVRILSQWEKTPLCGTNIRGGFLSFEMGLGKTRTMLALIEQEKDERVRNGGKAIETTLVVCPLGALSVWIGEIDKFYRDELSYYVLHPNYSENIEELTQNTIDKYDIVITTYDIVRKQFKLADVRCFIVKKHSFSFAEASLYKTSELKHEATVNGTKYIIVGVAKSENPDPSHYTALYSRTWKRIVADESTKFSGMATAIGNAMSALNAKSYFCLTGTPIMNYATDLYNAFRFMGLTMLKSDWNPRRYHALNLSSRILSKVYEDTEVKLPKANYITVELSLSELEKKMYKEVVVKLKDAWSLYKKGEKTFAAPLEMFLRLRQICVCAGVLAIEPDAKTRKRKDLEAMKKLLESSLSDSSNYPSSEETDSESFDKSLNNSGLIAMIEDAQEELGEEVVTKLFDEEEIIEHLKDPENGGSYTKIAKAVQLTLPLIAEKRKVLIFSSFVQVLNILKREFLKLGIGTLQLDGRVASRKRTDMQKVFNDREDDSFLVFLSSYKAGGMAINLTAAKTVILMEPWWNIATEDQAIARSHRTGQDEEVTIYSLIAIPSFETYLLKVQIRKDAMTKEYLKNHKEKYTKYKPDSSIAKKIIQSIIDDV